MSGIMHELLQMKDGMSASVVGDPATESEVILTAIRNECANDEEFAALIEAAGTEMALYDVIADADIASEAVKKITVTDWKSANFNRVANRTAIRMAKVNNDALYAKYSKYRDLLLETREKIYRKYGNKARQEAKKILKNNRNKAANMTSPAGKDIASKIDAQIAIAENKSAAKAKK